MKTVRKRYEEGMRNIYKKKREDEIMIKIYNKNIIYPVISDRTCDNFVIMTLGGIQTQTRETIQ